MPNGVTDYDEREARQLLVMVVVLLLLVAAPLLLPALGQMSATVVARLGEMVSL